MLACRRVVDRSSYRVGVASCGGSIELACYVVVWLIDRVVVLAWRRAVDRSCWHVVHVIVWLIDRVVVLAWRRVVDRPSCRRVVDRSSCRVGVASCGHTT